MSAIIFTAFQTFFFSWKLPARLLFTSHKKQKCLKEKSLEEKPEIFPHINRVLSGPFLHTLLDSQHQVNKPVDLNHPAFFPADLYLVQ